MSEQPPTNPAGPDNAEATWEHDPVKAERMAYAEKPFRDDAHELGKMAARAEVAAESEEADPNYHKDEDHGTPSYRHGFNMRMAQGEAINVAKHAGEKQGYAYDEAQTLRREAEDTEKALDR